VMLSRILQQEPSEFGVALIERGQESGGGGTTFDVGTVAQITELEAAPDFIAMMTQGDRRFAIVQWLDDEPHPRADVRYLDELEWTDDLQPLFDRADQVVRRALARASEFGDLPWAATVELSDEPLAAAWQLAAIAPLEQLDQVQLLLSASMKQLLDTTIELTLAAEELLGN